MHVLDVNSRRKPVSPALQRSIKTDLRRNRNGARDKRHWRSSHRRWHILIGPPADPWQRIREHSFAVHRIQCCLEAGPASTTLTQHLDSIGLTSRVSWHRSCRKIPPRVFCYEIVPCDFLLDHVHLHFASYECIRRMFVSVRFLSLRYWEPKG